ncbi:MAG: ArnT family glycosyltransferase [Bryobacteraceae bacterium]
MRWFWFGAAALLAWLCAAEIFAAWRESNIADEPLELAAGYSYLKTGDFRLNPEHPPLAKMLAALPLLLFHPVLPVDHPFWTSADEGGFGILFFGRNEDRLDGMLFAARLVSIFLTVCLGLAMALWARKMFGYGAALLALALYCFDPAIIAHGHYVKNDVPVTLFCFVACIAWCAFLNRPGVAPLALAGVTVGIAIATKFSALFLVPVFVILYAIAWWQRRKGLSLVHGAASVLAVVVLAAGVICLTYAIPAWIHGVELRGVNPAVCRDFLDRDPGRSMARLVARGIPRAHPFLDGLLIFVDHNTVGHQSYLLGMRGTRGWWYYFPVAFAVKTPAATLMLMALAGLLLIRALPRARLRSAGLAWFALAVPIAVFGGFSMASHLNIGIRHLLPIWPFAFILAAAAVTRWRFRYRAAAIAVLLAGLALESLLVYPHDLPFFNIFAGGPSNGPAILADSNTDWGQDAKNMARWFHAHPARNICLDYFGTADIGRPGLRGPPLPATWETERRASLDCMAAISTNVLYDPVGDPRQHAWVRELHPVARIGWAIYIYDMRRHAVPWPVPY